MAGGPMEPGMSIVAVPRPVAVRISRTTPAASVTRLVLSVGWFPAGAVDAVGPDVDAVAVGVGTVDVGTLVAVDVGAAAGRLDPVQPATSRTDAAASTRLLRSPR